MNHNEIINTLILWNFWEKEINTGIIRSKYLEKIQRFLETDEIIALTGIRRSGKSTILLQVLSDLIKGGVPKKNTLYINFEDPKFYNALDMSLLDDILAAYLNYLKPSGKVYLVLDEIQRINGWEHWVRAKYDQKQDIKIFVTGSNADFLSSEFATVLTGRHLQVAVTPLNFVEFLKFRNIDVSADPLWIVANKTLLENLTAQYLQLGGFPKIVLTEDELLRKELLAQYFADILTRDIVERFKIKDVSKLKNLAIFYGTNLTRRFSFHKIKKIAEFSLSLDSIHRFSHYLESSFLISFLQRFAYSLKRQNQADRKVYFADNGMHNAIAFKFSSDHGKLLENAVFHHLKQREDDIYYFSEKNEVDFILKKGTVINGLINVCYQLDDKETLLRETAALKEAMIYFKVKESRLIIAEGEGLTIQEKEGTISIVPFYQWALEE